MRKIYSLNKGWRFSRRDENKPETMEENYFIHFNYNTKAALFKGANGSTYYDGNWEKVDLPHDWDAEIAPQNMALVPQGYRPQGEAWYRKSFMLPPECEGKRVFLKFDAIAIESEIYFNNEPVARSHSAYIPTLIDVTDLLKPGVRNLIAVKTDNYVKEGWWYEGGGIYAPVYLICVEDTHFADNGVFVYSEKKDNNIWKLNVKAEIDGDAENTELEIEFDGKSYRGDSVVVDNPLLWSPEEPNLYSVKVRLYKNNEAIDECKTDFGFRTVVFDADRGCILNGEEIKLKGVAMHHDHAGVGVAIPLEVHRYRLKKLKEMGCNYIRTGHNPQNEAFYQACDEMGVMVADENRHFSSSAENLKNLRTIVRRDRNHPCVILWSLCNEEFIQGQKIAENIARSMKNAVYEEDGTRITTAAINSPLETNGVVKAVDMIGFNYFQYAYDEFHARVPELPIIGSENCSHMSTRGVIETSREKGYLKMNGDIPEENLHQWSAMPGAAWKAVNTRPFVAGMVYWTGMDYRGEPTPFRWPENISSYGAMDLCAFPKANYSWCKAMWRKDPQLILLPHWNFSEGETVEISSYSNCETVELFVNGVSLGERPNNIYEFIKWYAEFVPGTVMAIGRNGGKEVIRTEIKTANEAEKIVLNPQKKAFDAGFGDACVIDVWLEDKDGTRLPEADNYITFKVEGGGRLIGVGNGDNSSMEPDKANGRSLFKGYCQAIIEVCEENVPVRFVASCDGLENAVVVFENKGHSKYECIESLPTEMSLDYWWATDVLDHYPEEEFKLCGSKCWIPMTAGMGANPVVSGKKGYILWMNTFPYPKDYKGELSLVCPDIRGYVDIFVKDVLIYEGKNKREHNLVLPIGHLDLSGFVEIKVIFYLDGGEAGLYKDMYLSVKED